MPAGAWTTRTRTKAMSMTMSTNKAAASLARCVPAGDEGKQRKRVPKGYLPIVLVRDDDEGGAETTTETKVLVRVRDLKEPCIAALLEAAEEQFGYGQQGVLRVPCDAQRFHHVLNMARKPPKYYYSW